MGRTDNRVVAVIIAGAGLSGGVFGGCAKQAAVTVQLSTCAPATLGHGGPTTGPAMVFHPDPIVDSGNLVLSPTSVKLDQYRVPVTLQHLGGQGVLEGQYVDVRNGNCTNGTGKVNEWFNAYDVKNQFSYIHGDARFQEAIAYHAGDTFRASLDQIGYLMPATAVRVVAHCMMDDNAYFTLEQDSNGQIIDKVCLGDSVQTPGASYADDEIVTIHELQHATTLHTYTADPTSGLNQFWYDEAGSLNEAISDFVGLVNTAALVSSQFDPMTFSRWALGTFIPNSNGIRGAHKCPVYDSTYPLCTNFPAFSADKNTISYVYPDGVGWPYANNYQGPGYVASAFSSFGAQEEIHNAGVLMEGALWDIYQALVTANSAAANPSSVAQAKSMTLVLQALKTLVKPDAVFLSPVSFPAFAGEIVKAVNTPALGFSSSEQSAVAAVLTARGLINQPLLPLNWATVGPGKAASPGLEILDNPIVLQAWLTNLGVPIEQIGSLVGQSITTGINGQLDPGELVAVWFDLQNTSSVTAGGVQLLVTVSDPNLVSLEAAYKGQSMNVGYQVDSKGASAQINYGKVNGSAIKTSMTSATAALNVSTGTDYFLTDPFFDQSYRTAIWMKVAPGTSGKTVTFRVQAVPANLQAYTSISDIPVLNFTAKIN